MWFTDCTSIKQDKKRYVYVPSISDAIKNASLHHWHLQVYNLLTLKKAIIFSFFAVVTQSGSRRIFFFFTSCLFPQWGGSSWITSAELASSLAPIVTPFWPTELSSSQRGSLEPQAELSCSTRYLSAKFNPGIFKTLAYISHNDCHCHFSCVFLRHTSAFILTENNHLFCFFPLLIDRILLDLSLKLTSMYWFFNY